MEEIREFIALPSLISLCLDCVLLDQEKVALLSDYLATAPILKNLHLSCFFTKKADYSDILKSIELTKSIETLTIEDNQADLSFIKALARLIRNSETIMSIVALFKNEADEEGEASRSFLKALKKNTSLVNLKVDLLYLFEWPTHELFEYIKTSRLNSLSLFNVDLDKRMKVRPIPKTSMLAHLDLIYYHHEDDYFGQVTLLGSSSSVRQLESFRIVKSARLFLSMRPINGRRERVPREIMILILIRCRLTDEFWPGDWLATITRCLLDRRTLGKVQHDIVPFSQPALHAVCRKVIQSLD